MHVMMWHFGRSHFEGPKNSLGHWDRWINEMEDEAEDREEGEED